MKMNPDQDPDDLEDDEEVKDGDPAPMIDDSSLIPPPMTEDELDKIWVASGRKLPRPKENN